MKRVHVYISGRVQGVFFRANTRKEARKRNLKGWVKNLSDGGVEAVFEGPEDKVEEIINWCWKGSPSARVENVEVKREEPEGLSEFKIRY